jgi:hypothetical protein
MKSILTYCSQFLILLLLTGCEKQYPWNFKTIESTSIIVDGIITNELIPQCIRLSRTNTEMNDTMSPVSGATVFVYDSLGAYEFVESDDKPGSYYSEPFQVVVRQQYRLTILIENDTFQAVAEAVPVTAMDSLIVVLNDSTDLYWFRYSGTGEPSMTEVFYDWSHDPDYCSIYGNCYAKETFYTLDNIDVNEIFHPPRKIIYFPHGTVLVRRKYGLSETHQQFIRSLLMETDWSGGIFDVQHGNVETNVSNGALGFFAACMVISDTTTIHYK